MSFPRIRERSDVLLNRHQGPTTREGRVQLKITSSQGKYFQATRVAPSDARPNTQHETPAMAAAAVRPRCLPSAASVTFSREGVLPSVRLRWYQRRRRWHRRHQPFFPARGHSPCGSGGSSGSGGGGGGDTSGTSSTSGTGAAFSRGGGVSPAAATTPSANFSRRGGIPSATPGASAAAPKVSATSSRGGGHSLCCSGGGGVGTPKGICSWSTCE